MPRSIRAAEILGGLVTRQLLIFHTAFFFTWAAQAGFAQQIGHSDVFFTFGETRIEIATQADRLAFPQVMPTSGFFAQANSNPGFFSETDVGGGTGPNDTVAYNVLDDLVYWSDGGFSEPKRDTRIRIINNPSFLDDTLIGVETGEQRASFSPLTNSIGQSNTNGDFHSHVDFRLEPFAAEPEDQPLFGAYGLKLSLSTDSRGIDESDPFFVVFRFGIDEEQFFDALDDFHELLTDDNVLGDFNGDGVLSAADIDLLSLEVVAGTNNVAFDLTGDRQVDELDRATWVNDLVGTLFGDADLDGTVQFPDFVSLSSTFGMPGGWSKGDFDGNGMVQFADFIQLSNHFGMGEAFVVATVPEPMDALSVMFTMIAGMAAFRRGTRKRNSRV